MSELSEMVDRLKELVDSGAEHNPKLHEGLNHCEGCERIIVSRWIKEHLQHIDDTAPQEQFGGRSRRDIEHERLSGYWQAHKADAEARKKKSGKK